MLDRTRPVAVRHPCYVRALPDSLPVERSQGRPQRQKAQKQAGPGVCPGCPQRRRLRLALTRPYLPCAPNRGLSQLSPPNELVQVPPQQLEVRPEREMEMAQKELQPSQLLDWVVSSEPAVQA